MSDRPEDRVRARTPRRSRTLPWLLVVVGAAVLTAVIWSQLT